MEFSLFSAHKANPLRCQHGALSRFLPRFPDPFAPKLHHDLHQGDGLATYQKRGDSTRVTVRWKGVYDSATFPTKGAAVAWAQRREAEIDAGKTGKIPAGKTFGDLLTRYAEEVSPTKPGERWERIRISS